MNWIRDAVTDGKGQGISSSRIVLLVSGLTLSLCTLILTVAALWRIELVPALTVFGGSLATMSGAGYVTTKWAGARERSVYDESFDFGQVGALGNRRGAGRFADVDDESLYGQARRTGDLSRRGHDGWPDRGSRGPQNRNRVET